MLPHLSDGRNTNTCETQGHRHLAPGTKHLAHGTGLIRGNTLTIGIFVMLNKPFIWLSPKRGKKTFPFLFPGMFIGTSVTIHITVPGM